MYSVRMLFVVTVTSLSSWAVTDAQAQNAIKLFGATPVTPSLPCEPDGCHPEADRMLFDEAWLMLACKGRPSAILSSTADGRGRLVADNFIEVNGENVCAGGTSSGGAQNCFNFPVFEAIGTPALDAYQSVPPTDATRSSIDRKLQPRRLRRHLRQLRRVARDKLHRLSEGGYLP